jgi:hypothetical protein
MTLDEIRARSGKLAQRVKWRNWREYGAGILVIAAFAYYTWASPNGLIKIGSLCTIAATLFIMYQLRKRSSAPDVASEMVQLVTFYRRQLEAERDMLQSIWLWYVLPLVPGVIIFAIGVSATRFGADFTVYFSVAALIAGAVILLNLWAARKMQQQIDELPR